LIDEIVELVRRLDGDGGCPSCAATIEIVDGSLVGVRPSRDQDQFDGPDLLVCLSCENGIRLVGPNRLPHETLRISR